MAKEDSWLDSAHLARMDSTDDNVEWHPLNLFCRNREKYYSWAAFLPNVKGGVWTSIIPTSSTTIGA